MNTFLEEKLDAESRNKMKDSSFGLPEERKYPLNDASHVKSAIAFFRYCPADKKHSLARRIISAAKKFGVVVSKDSKVWKIAHEAVMFEDEYDETAGIVLQEAERKKKDEDDLLDDEINDDDVEPVDYTDSIDDIDASDDDPIDYSTGDTDDDTNTDPVDYTQDIEGEENAPEDDPGTMADDDEPTDYTQVVDAENDPNEGDDAPQDYTQDVNPDDSDPNIDNSNVKPEDPALGGNTDNNSQAQSSPNDGGDDETEPEDYTQDIDGGDAVDNPEGNPEGDGSDLPPADGTDAGMQPSGGTELQNMQNDVFSDLSPEQMKIKIANIKQSFIDLYNDVVEVLERLSTVNKSSNNLESINFATITLNELKTMLNDHLVSTFETKSLVENQITLQRFLAIYTMVIKILEKVSNKQSNEDKK